VKNTGRVSVQNGLRGVSRTHYSGRASRQEKAIVGKSGFSVADNREAPQQRVACATFRDVALRLTWPGIPVTFIFGLEIAQNFPILLSSGMREGVREF
jgi:hypothetical protein